MAAASTRAATAPIVAPCGRTITLHSAIDGNRMPETRFIRRLPDRDVQMMLWGMDAASLLQLNSKHSNETIIHYVVRSGREAVLEMLLGRFTAEQVSIPSLSGETPRQLAVSLGRVRMVAMIDAV